jgi:hypothetical protein
LSDQAGSEHDGSPAYEHAWRQLSGYLLRQWDAVIARGSFDLSRVFAGDAAAQAVNVHLYFVQLLAEKLKADRIRVDLPSFSRALRTGTAHPEVTLLIANSQPPAGQFLAYDPTVSVLRSGDEVYSCVWTYLLHPLAIKVCYLKSGAPVREPEGYPWHPTRQRKIVKLSPYKGDTRPLVARRDLRI